MRLAALSDMEKDSVSLTVLVSGILMVLQLMNSWHSNMLLLCSQEFPFVKGCVGRCLQGSLAVVSGP